MEHLYGAILAICFGEILAEEHWRTDHSGFCHHSINSACGRRTVNHIPENFHHNFGELLRCLGQMTLLHADDPFTVRHLIKEPQFFHAAGAIKGRERMQDLPSYCASS